MTAGLFQDWRANTGRREIQIALVLFRAAQVAQQWPLPARKVMTGVYRLWTLNGQGIDLPPQVSAGPGLAIHHGAALVVHGSTRLGRSVVLRQSTTLGERVPGAGAPEIGDFVQVGAHALVLGHIKVGDSAFIAAGATVLVDVPRGATAITRVDTEIRRPQS